MDGCQGGGAAGMGATCSGDDDCASGLACEDNFCVIDDDDDDDDDDDGGDDDQPRVWFSVGGSLGLGVATAGMESDRFPTNPDNPPANLVETGMGECALEPFPEGRGPYCVRVAQGGVVPHGGIRIQAGVYPFEGVPIGAAVWVRFAPDHGEGNLAFIHLGGRLELQLTEPTEAGVHASMFAGGGGGQIQIQPPGNGEDAPYIISGLGNISAGGYVGYRFVRYFGLVAQADFMFQVPTFLFNIDLTASAAVYFP